MEPGIPGLLGLRASYVSAQLGGWRYGTRTAASPDCMQIVASLLTEDDAKAVAAFLSARPAPSDPSFAPRGSLPMPLPCGSQPN
jgi:cytochrome c553